MTILSVLAKTHVCWPNTRARLRCCQTSLRTTTLETKSSRNICNHFPNFPFGGRFVFTRRVTQLRFCSVLSGRAAHHSSKTMARRVAKQGMPLTNHSNPCCFAQGSQININRFIRRGGLGGSYATRCGMQQTIWDSMSGSLLVIHVFLGALWG